MKIEIDMVGGLDHYKVGVMPNVSVIFVCETLLFPFEYNTTDTLHFHNTMYGSFKSTNN